MRRRDRKKYLLLFICLFFILISIPRMKSLISHCRRLRYYEDEIKMLRMENGKLAEKIRSMQDDPYYAEKMLRENHGYIKEGEYVYRVEK
jgi:cell division protein FtsB